MATSEKIGELYVDITGKDRGASAALDKVKGKAVQAESSMMKLQAASSKVSSTISTILMPVALIGSITGAIAMLVRMRDKANETRDALLGIADAAEATLQSERRALQARTELEAKLLRITEDGIALAEQRAKLEEKSSGIMAHITDIASVGNVFFGTRFKTIKATNDELDKMSVKEAAILEARRELVRVAEEERIAAEEHTKAIADQARALDDRVKYLMKVAEVEERERKKRIEDFERENEAHKKRLRDIDELDRKIRDSLGGGLFGEGFVAGGPLDQIAGYLAQLADKGRGI